MSDITEVINEITDFLSEVGGDLGEELTALVLTAVPKIVEMIELPGWLKGLVMPLAANTFLHQAVAKIKDKGHDGPQARQIALKYTRKLYQMPDNWEPGWLMKGVS